MEGLEGKQLLHPNLSCIKTRPSVDPASKRQTRGEGSPSSSASCHEAQPTVGRAAITAQTSDHLAVQADGPPPASFRTRHWRKPVKKQSLLATTAGGATQEALKAQEVTEKALAKRFKPKTRLPEFVYVPVLAAKKATRTVTAPSNRTPQGAPLEAPVPQAGTTDSPLSGASAATHRNFAASAHQQGSTSPVAGGCCKKISKGNKRGGPCYVCWETESTAWRTGVKAGLFPGEALCNRHGTADSRKRLFLYVDAEGIRELHSSSMPEEDKAAASVLFYREGRAGGRRAVRVRRPSEAVEEEWADMLTDEEEAMASDEEDASNEAEARADAKGKGKALHSWEGLEVAREGGAGASQPWGAQSPTHHSRCRKRKASSDGSGDDIEVPVSKTRRLFGEEPAGTSKRSGSLQGIIDIGSQQADLGLMDVDSQEEQGLEDFDLKEAVIGLLGLQRVSSADSEVHLL